MYDSLTLDDKIRITGKAIRRAGHNYEMVNEGGATVFKVFDDDGKLITDISIRVDSDGRNRFEQDGPGRRSIPFDDPRWVDIEHINGVILRLLAIESGHPEHAGIYRYGSNSKPEVPADSQTVETEPDIDPALLQIPEGTRRKVAKMSREGKTARTIADTLDLSISRINTIKSELRKEFGEEVIPVNNEGARKAIHKNKPWEYQKLE